MTKNPTWIVVRVLTFVIVFLTVVGQSFAESLKQYPEETALSVQRAGEKGNAVSGRKMAEPLYLSLASPPPTKGENCGHMTASIPSSGKPGGRQRPVQESEHRPVPMRTYYFNDHRRLAEVKACVRRPDGSVIEPELRLGVNPSISFPTPLGEGPAHGANNVYVVEQGVEDGVFTVRTAKWITMHHSCGWGHDNRFDERRTKPQSLDSIPFEIVIDDLWEANFHAKVTSGDELPITVLSYGNPVQGASVTITSEQGWSKKVVTNQDGVASVQLIRDYYPPFWSMFNRRHRGKFLVTARYDATLNVAESYRGNPYERISYVATLPWKYSPSQQDYSSYSYGLFIGILSLTVSGAGVYAYRERRKKPYRGIVFDE